MLLQSHSTYSYSRRVVVGCEQTKRSPIMDATNTGRTRRSRAAATIAGLLTLSVPAFSTWGATTASAATCTGTVDASTVTLPLVGAAMGAPVLWAQGFKGQGIDVAVIDTGVNAVPGLASTGKVVDAVDLSFDAPRTNLRYRDLHGHGTNMAGIIAGDGSGGLATTGVAPGARIINVKVGAADGSVDTSQVIAALDWVAQNKTANGRNIRVVNLAYDTDGAVDYLSDPLTHAVENAWKAGIVVVVSGGNDGKGVQRLGNPALDPYIIAVGGSEWDPTRLSFKAATWSSTGDGIRNPDFVAPGGNVASLQVPGSYLDTTYPDARIIDPVSCLTLFRGSGTSQAAAATSGAVALLLQQRPTLTPDQVKDLLVSTATVRNGSVTQYGAGLLNVAGASAAPARNVTQNFGSSSGKGTLEKTRGTFHLTGATPGDILVGEYHAFLSSFSATKWAGLADRRAAWTGLRFDAAGRMTAGTWMGSTWSGSTWSGSTWSGSTWSGSTWSGVGWR